MLRGRRVEHVLYPTFPPNTDAQEVLAWLARTPAFVTLRTNVVLGARHQKRHGVMSSWVPGTENDTG